MKVSLWPLTHSQEIIKKPHSSQITNLLGLLSCLSIKDETIG